nr:hypothetical protein [Naviculales sp.]
MRKTYASFLRFVQPLSKPFSKLVDKFRSLNSSSNIGWMSKSSFAKLLLHLLQSSRNIFYSNTFISSLFLIHPVRGNKYLQETSILEPYRAIYHISIVFGLSSC